jgi:CheY-like chemotaxis protein
MEPQQKLRIDGAMVKRILDNLDAQDAAPHETRADAQPRYPYRVPALNVHLQQGDGAMARYVLPSRSLGPTGISFLVNKFVYPETACKIDLITTHNHWQSVAGHVTGCTYVQGTGAVYDAQARFSRPIDIALFTAQALRVRLLLVDDSPTARALLSQMLRGFNADVVTCEDGQQAIEQAMSTHFDAILMDMEMPVLNGFDATRQLRASNFVQPIVAVTGLTSPADRQRCFDVGCDEYLPKPADRNAIADLINRLRPEPLVSTLDVHEPEMAALVDQYVHELHARALDMQNLFAHRDMAGLAGQLRSIKGEAPGLGFEPIGRAAAELEELIAQGASPVDINLKLGRFARLCCAVRPANRNGAESADPALAGAANALA